MWFKPLIFRILFILLIGSVTKMNAQPPGDGTDPSTPANVMDDETYAARCLDLVFQDNHYGTINIDCPGRTVFNITVLRNLCGCENFNIYIGGEKIKTVDKNGLKTLSFSEADLSKWNLWLAETGETSLTVEIICWVPGSAGTGAPGNFVNHQRISSPIKIVKSGEEFEALIETNKNQVIGLAAPTSTSESSICCQPGLSVTYSESEIQATSTQITTTTSFNANVEFNNGPFTIISPITWSMALSNIKNVENINNVTKTFTFTGEDKVCINVGHLIIATIKTYQKFKANCVGPDVAIGKPYDIAEVTGSSKVKTYTAPKIGCPKIKKPEFRPNRNFADRLNCKGNLELDLNQQSGLIIEWTDENGNNVESANGNLSNVPLGQYTVTISNQCCESITETYYLCESTTKSDYIKKENDEWCRTVYCYGEGCNEEYTECVTPDRIEDKFDQNLKKCIKEYYYQDQLLGTTSVNASSETEWDNVYENCVTTYFCNGSEVYEEEYEPETSEWIYDDFWKECQLNVNCMGEELEDVDQSEAEIEWEWDDFWEECVSTYMSCDGNEVEGEESLIPYEIGEWTYDSQYGCVREILCVDGGDVFRQEISPTYAPEGGQGQCDEGLFEWKVFCDGEETDFICLANLSPPTLESRFVKSEKVFIKSMNSELQITLKNTSKDITIMIYDVLGRVSHEKPVNNEYSTIDISLIGVKSGIYVVTVLEAGSVIHSEKIFIQN